MMAPPGPPATVPASSGGHGLQSVVKGKGGLSKEGHAVLRRTPAQRVSRKNMERKVSFAQAKKDLSCQDNEKRKTKPNPKENTPSSLGK